MGKRGARKIEGEIFIRNIVYVHFEINLCVGGVNNAESF